MQNYLYQITYQDKVIGGKMYLFNDNQKLPYMLFVPDDMQENTNMVVGNFTTGNSTMNFNDTVNALIDIVNRGDNIEMLLKKICYEQKCPILFPIIPRFNGFYSTFLTGDVYKNNFERLDMHKKNGKVFISEDDKQYLSDIHKQEYDMIINSKKFIEENLGIRIQDKVIMTGYSAAGHFANAFSVLHPDIVSMVIAGGTDGILTLPYKEINGITFPVGVSDISNFDFEEFSKIKFFTYMGTYDKGDCAALNDNKEAAHLTCFNTEQAIIINQMFKNCRTQERLRKVVDIYKQLGIDIEIKYYDADHREIGKNLEIANQVATDVYDFISRNLENSKTK